LELPGPRKGKALSEETKRCVIDFYCDDEYSRLMPGKKDCVSIARNVKKQKRLLLCDLKELYAAFKQKYPDLKVGFSKFCSLKPKWCVLVGCSGIHSVCVCTIHQNVVLMLGAVNLDKNQHKLIGHDGVQQRFQRVYDSPVVLTAQLTLNIWKTTCFNNSNLKLMRKMNHSPYNSNNGQLSTAQS
jgi:hypothetical protein